jgi:hypothetical protein
MTELAVRELRAPEGFWALAIHRPDMGDNEALMLAVERDEHDDDERWLCVGQTERGRARYLGFENDVAHGDYPKLCALLGFTFDELELDGKFRRLIEWQQMCLRTMGPNMWRSLEQATVEEIAEWRREIEQLDSGTLLTAGLTLSDPRAISN